MKTWQFEPLDSSFFRGARSFQQNEQGFLESQFPPTAQTLAGVVRAAIAESKGVDWQKFRKGEQANIADLIGASAEDAGKLSFVGPYLMQNGKRLYPMPLHVLYSSQKESRKEAWGRLAPSQKASNTDMGEKHLPEVVKNIEGAKPVEDAWLDEDNLQLVLNGKHPQGFYKKEDLFAHESRTGIARDNPMRKTKQGALFFTRHIRFKDGVKLGMNVDGADDITPKSMLRLGGEGRMAHVTISDVVDARLRRNDNKVGQFMLVLLTHGDFKGVSEPELPQGLEIVSACVGKAVREGGWDYAKGQPKPLKSLVPSGSVFFIKGDASKLQGNHIGERTLFGYGEFAVGGWH